MPDTVCRLWGGHESGPLRLIRMCKLRAAKAASAARQRRVDDAGQDAAREHVMAANGCRKLVPRVLQRSVRTP